MAGKLTFLMQKDDLAGAAVLTASSELAALPWSNALIDPIAKIGRTAAAATTLDLLFNLGGSLSWDLFVVGNHNIRSTATVTVQAGTTSGTSNLTATMTWREFDMWYKSATVLTYAYVRLLVDDTGNPDGYISAGRFLIGHSTELLKQFSFGARKTQINLKRQNVSEFGVKFVERINTLMQVSLSWHILTDAQRNVLFDSFLLPLGRAACPVFLYDFGHRLSPTVDGFYMRMESDPEETLNVYKASGECIFEEESRGIRLTI